MGSFVGIDLGASNTRYVSDNGVFHEVENNVKEVAIGENIRIKPWQGDGDTPEKREEETVHGNLDVEIYRLSGETKHIRAGARYLVGSLATRIGASSRPTGLQNKAEQSINYTNAILATALSKLLMGETDGLVNAYIALPPVELSNRSTSEATLKEELVGDYRVKFNTLGKEVSFSITSVTCVEESFLTLIAFFFNIQGGFRVDALPFKNGNVLGIDIGASTTDLAVVKNAKFVDKSGQTYKLGGNFVLDWIADGIRAKYGYDAEADELQRAVETGKIRQGATLIDVSDLVIEGKKEFAVKLVDMMQSYFIKIAMQPHTFVGIIVGGGGSMASKYIDESGAEFVTSRAMSEYIWDEFKNICPSVPVEPVSDDPRHANITGLFIRALVDKLAKQRALAEQQKKDMEKKAQSVAEKIAVDVKLDESIPDIQL